MVGNEHDQVARAAVLAVHAALQTLRQHPDARDLSGKALRGAVRAVVAATRAAPLVLRLHAGAVHVDDTALLPFHPGEAPFGRLRDAGVGEVALAVGMQPDAIERLLLGLAAMPAAGGPDDDLHAWLANARIDQVELRALADDRSADDDTVWAELPPPGPTSPELRALLARDLTANLPALVVRQLLDDCDRDGALPGDELDRMLARLLERRDAASASALLVEAHGQPLLAGPASDRLTALARHRCDADWFASALRTATHDEAFALSGLAMQLGDDTAARFAHAAARVAHPLSHWFGELLGHPCD